MDSQTCRCRNCYSPAIFVCDCPDLYTCNQCLVAHMKTAHNIESTHADEICGMIDEAIRDRQNCGMNKFIEFISSLLSKYTTDVTSSSAWIRNDFIAKSRIISSMADSATKFLNQPLESPMIRINEETLLLFDAYFSTDLQKERILQYYALESIPSLKQKIHEKVEACQELGKLMDKLFEQKNKEIDEHTRKIRYLEGFIEQREKEIKKLKENEIELNKTIKKIEDELKTKVEFLTKSNRDLKQVHQENELIFAGQLKAKDKESREKINELNQIIKAKQVELIIQAKISREKIEVLDQDIKARNVAHDLSASHEKERKAANDREIAKLKQTLENNLELLKAKDMTIKELEQSIKKGKEDLEKVSTEHNILVSLHKEQEATNDRQSKGLMEVLDQNVHQISNKDIRIETLEQSIKECKEALEKCNAVHEMNIDLLQRNHAKDQEYLNQLSLEYQALRDSNSEVISENLKLKIENESCAVLSRVLLNPFQNFPNIRGLFVFQEANQIWDMEHSIGYLCLETQSYSIVSLDRTSVDIYDKFTSDRILSYHTKDRFIKKIFASINEKFLIIEGSPMVYLLEILDYSIKERAVYEQKINYVMCNTDSTCLISYSDSVAIVLDLISMKEIAAVTLKLF